MSLNLFKDPTDRDEDEGPEPIPQRTMSKSSNEDFGTHIVVNEGVSTIDMEAWYVDINEDTGEASQIPQRKIMMQMMRHDKEARRAFFRGDKEDRKNALQQEDMPDWVLPAANSLEANVEEDFQTQLEHLEDNLFRAAMSWEKGNKSVWVIQAEKGGRLVLASKLDNYNYFKGRDVEFEVRSKGEVTVTPPEIDQNPEQEDLDREFVAADIEDFSREEVKEDDLDEETLQEFLKAVYREHDLQENFEYTVEYADGFLRVNADNGEAFYYSFIDYEKVNKYFGVPDWTVHILWEEQNQYDRIPYPNDGGDD